MKSSQEKKHEQTANWKNNSIKVQENLKATSNVCREGDERELLFHFVYKLFHYGEGT